MAGEPKRKYTILYVESDPASFTQTAKVLSKRGCRLLVAENGQEGLKIYDEARPDVVVTEVDLPVMDGIEMARRIKGYDRDACIIVTTDCRDTNSLVSAIEIGVHRYILKPIDYSKLSEALETCLSDIKEESGHREADVPDMLEHIPLSVAVTDTEGVIEYVNTPFVVATGYKPDEVIGKDMAILRSPSDLPITYTNLQKCMAAGLRWQGELLSRNKKGEDFWENAYLSPVKDADGNLTSFIRMSEDINRRKKGEDDIRNLNAELEYRLIQRNALLEASNKELDEFCDAVSHDLRGPLSRLQGFSRVLIDDYRETLDEQGKAHIEKINRTCQELKQIFDGLLDLSQITRRSIVYQQLDLSEIVTSVCDALARSDSSREVEFVVAPGVLVRGDAGLLKLAMENLLQNAWKFTSPHRQARIEFGVARLGNKTVYFVRDDGIGFDSKYAHKIFKPFQHLHDSEGLSGAGLGLASAQRIIQRHGGRIWVEGEIEKGATFYFTLN